MMGVNKRERPIVQGEDAERFMERVRINNGKMKEQLDKMSKNERKEFIIKLTNEICDRNDNALKRMND